LNYVRVAALLAAVSAVLAAQAVGPDVIVGDLGGVSNYGSGTPVGGVPTAAFAIGTTSCNLGTAELSWFSGTNQKPVIGQSIYRLKNGRFEQISFGWLKHGFFALAENACASCQTPANYGNYLGINCSDPYSSSLNGDQTNIGPRFEVNPFTGVYPWPYSLTPSIANNGATAANETTVLSGRNLVAHTDLDPALNAGAQYFVEGQYVHPDDASFGNGTNNVSYRPINVSPSGASYSIAMTGVTVRQKPALWAWKAADPTVSIKNVDVPGEGRFVVAYKSTALGGGQWHHEYAVFNINSDRAGGSFTVTLPAGTTATTAADHFRDVHYHSGEPQSGTDWTLANAAGSAISWTCAQPNNNAANALRWGTTYNFRFDANRAWLGDVSIGLFKPGSPSAVAAQLCREPGLSNAPISGGPSVSDVPYDFVDATAGTAGPAGDDVGLVVSLPFTFTHFGVPLTQVVISTNGYIAAPTEPGDVFTNVAIPNSGTPNGMIAAFWDDLEIGNVGANGSATGWCRYLTTGTAPNQRFVVQWNNAQRINQNTNISFEVILDETSNNITITHILTNGGNSATRGIENANGTAGLQISHNTSNSAVAGTSKRIVNAPYAYGDTALLTMAGDGSFANPFAWNVVSDAGAPLTLFVDLAPGPVFLPFLQGSVGLAMTPGMIAISDATGFFGPADPTAWIGTCNEWNLALPVGLDPVPAGLIDLWFQALVWSPLAPNGFVRTSTTVTY
jgi:hypothetical protein